MTKEQIAEVIKAGANSLGWSVDVDSTNGNMEFRQFSPAGEDFSFVIDGHDPFKEIADYVDDFDPEEHAEEWIRIKVETENSNFAKSIPGIRTLMLDADKIADMLDDLRENMELCAEDPSQYIKHNIPPIYKSKFKFLLDLDNDESKENAEDLEEDTESKNSSDNSKTRNKARNDFENDFEL